MRVAIRASNLALWIPQFQHTPAHPHLSIDLLYPKMMFKLSNIFIAAAAAMLMLAGLTSAVADNDGQCVLGRRLYIGSRVLNSRRLQRLQRLRRRSRLRLPAVPRK